jgi:3-oxoacyl-[acyl-carrier-protein] synthase-3
VIARASAGAVSITGIGCHVPDRILANDELASLVDTTDEWILSRTGIRERRIAAAEEALSDICVPACLRALEDAGVAGEDVDCVIVATVTPDMFFPSTAALVADRIGARGAAAYDLSAGCAGFVYALAQAYPLVAAGLSRCALVVGGDLLSKVTDYSDRSTCILFGDGAGAVVLEQVSDGGFLGFELGADGSGGHDLLLPAGGSREPATTGTIAGGRHFIQMNGREVFKFGTRVLVSSATALLGELGVGADEVDVYIPHQANKRIIDHASHRLGIPPERVVINVDRYGNTSSASIPLALAEAIDDGRVKTGDNVLMTGMGAGLTWGSTLIEWTGPRA